MKTIGIDIGTTTISAVVFDEKNQNVIESRTILNDSFIETSYSWERIQNADVIVKKTQMVLDELIDRHEDAVAVGITGQMHGIVYLDQAGRCVSPLYTWQDGRGNLKSEEGKTLVEYIKERYGVSSASGYGLITHIYNVKNKLVPTHAVTFCTIADYLVMVLTERKTPMMHVSNAASLGFFDSKKKKFRMDLLEELSGTECHIPSVSLEVKALGVYRNLSVMTAIGDNQASFLGAAGEKSNTVLLNMGTGGQVSMLTDSYYEIPGIDTRPFLKGKYLLVGASLCGGRAYAILEKFFRTYVSAFLKTEAGDQYSLMGNLARIGKEKGKCMRADTRYNGTRVDSTVTGSFYEITEDNFTPESMIYSVIEGMARELYEMYQVISERTGISAEQIIGSGNGLRKNETLLHVFESLFHDEITLSSVREEAACGAAKSCILGENKI